MAEAALLPRWSLSTSIGALELDGAPRGIPPSSEIYVPDGAPRGGAFALDDALRCEAFAPDGAPRWELLASALGGALQAQLQAELGGY